MRHVIEHFEGFVISIKENSFWVRFEDINGTEEEGELLTDKILTDDEKKYLEVGVYFDWVFFNDGFSEFKFVKEFWTQKEIDDAHAAAEEMLKWFKTLPTVDEQMEKDNERRNK